MENTTTGKEGTPAYRCDEQGNLLSVTSPKGEVASYTYDAKTAAQEAAQNGLKKVPVNNAGAISELRKIESGDWKKVFQNGYDAASNEVSIHYFQNVKTGTVFDVKVKNKWSDLK